MKYTCEFCNYERRIVKTARFYGVDDKASPNSIMIECGGVPRCPHCKIDLLDSNDRWNLYRKKKEVNAPKSHLDYTPKRKIN